MRTFSPAIHEGRTPTSAHRAAALGLIVAAALLVGCSADSPTGVADQRFKSLKPKAEHVVCYPHSEIEFPYLPSDTISLPPSGTCPEGFDNIIWW